MATDVMASSIRENSDPQRSNYRPENSNVTSLDSFLKVHHSVTHVIGYLLQNSSKCAVIRVSARVLSLSETARQCSDPCESVHHFWVQNIF